MYQVKYIFQLMLDFAPDERVMVLIAPVEHKWFTAESDSGWKPDDILAVYDARDFTRPLMTSAAELVLARFGISE